MADRKATHVTSETHERLRVLNFKRRVSIQAMIDEALQDWLDKAEEAGDRWWSNRFPEANGRDA